jgi:hypothetical protein
LFVLNEHPGLDWTTIDVVAMASTGTCCGPKVCIAQCYDANFSDEHSLGL